MASIKHAWPVEEVIKNDFFITNVLLDNYDDLSDIMWNHWRNKFWIIFSQPHDQLTHWSVKKTDVILQTFWNAFSSKKCCILIHISLKFVPVHSTDNKWEFMQVTNHYLNQCWPCVLWCHIALLGQRFNFLNPSLFSSIINHQGQIFAETQKAKIVIAFIFNQ